MVKILRDRVSVICQKLIPAGAGAFRRGITFVHVECAARPIRGRRRRGRARGSSSTAAPAAARPGRRRSRAVRLRSNSLPGANWQDLQIMELEALRLLILSKFADGKLPLESLPNVWAGPGNGETCDACGAIVTKREFVMEATSLAGGRKPLHLHAACFWVWEAELRPQLASRGSASSPVTAPAPG